MSTAKPSRRVTPSLRGSRDRVAAEERRLHAMQLLKDGHTQSEVSRILGVTRQAVSLWVKEQRNGGVKALASKGKPGRKTAPSEADRREILAALKKGPVANGYRNELWTLRRVSQVIARLTGRTKPSTSRTWQLLRELGWSCQRPARRARQQDAEAVATFRTKTWKALKKTPNGSES